MTKSDAEKAARKAADKVRRTGDYEYVASVAVYGPIVLGRDEQGYYVFSNDDDKNMLNKAEAIEIAADYLMKVGLCGNATTT